MMRSFLLIALSAVIAVSPAFCAADAASAGGASTRDGDSGAERGAVPALMRTWRSTVGAGGAAIRSTGDFLGSGIKAVTGLFTRGESSPAPKRDKQRLRLEVVGAVNPVLVRATSSIEVQLRVVNPTKRAQVLEFSSGKRVEAVVRNAAGQIVSRASEGGTEAGPGSLVTVNPGERLEYRLSLPTSGLKPGNVYTLEAAVTGQAGLLARMEITAR
jgi:hypothetical protein